MASVLETYQKELDSLNSQRASLQARLDETLSENHKGMGVRRWHKKINEMQQSLKRLDASINRADKRLYDQTLAEQGKDPRAARFEQAGDTIEKGLQSAADFGSAALGGQFGKFGVGAASGAGTNTPLGGTFFGGGSGFQSSGKSGINPLYLLLGFGLLLLLIKGK